MKFSFKQFIIPHFWPKFFLVTAAIILMGFNLSLLIEAGWGTDPYSFMNINIANLIGWTLGNWQLLLNVVLLVIIFFVEPSVIGIGTLFNMILIGYTADFFCWVWKTCGLHDIIINPEFFHIRLIVFAVSIFFFVVTAATYMNCDMGLSPYDGAAKIIIDRIKGPPFSVLRIAYDMSGVVLGLAAGLLSPDGIQGSLPGTIIVGLTLGPAITTIGRLMKNRISFFKN